MLFFNLTDVNYVKAQYLVKLATMMQEEKLYYASPLSEVKNLDSLNIN